MASFDLISEAFKSAWTTDAGRIALCPPANIYYDRPQKPEGLAGFPYMSLLIEQDDFEVVTKVEAFNSLVHYTLHVHVWTCQGQTGGETAGDALTDQGRIQRALEAVLNFLPPNTAWYDVEGFLHCLKGEMSVRKDPELYLGKDVYHSIQTWHLLVSE